MKKTESFVEHVLDPHSGDSNRVDNVGYIDDRTPECFRPHTACQDDSEEKCDDHDSDTANDVNLDHVDHRCLEKLCPQQLLIIPQTVKGPLAHRVADAFHIKEAHDDCTDNRIQEHDDEEEQRRSQKADDHFLILFQEDVPLSLRLFSVVLTKSGMADSICLPYRCNSRLITEHQLMPERNHPE